ncbi:hypothetical protein NQ318_016628, partial [Aromia moschata]
VLQFHNVILICTDIENSYIVFMTCRAHPEGFVVTRVDQLPDYFDKKKKTKFVTHGWMAKGTSSVCENIKKGFLKSDVNVFVMDWSPVAGNILYPVAAGATAKVGKHYGKFLNRLINDIGVEPKDLHLVGHSLGAHVSGFAGRELRGQKAARITGLDPALPGFGWPSSEEGRLNRNDSDFVDVIHTCAGYLGMKDPIGHVDFYPNGGGPPQPGCNLLEVLEACSHARSWQLFAESLVTDEPYIATRCESVSLLGGPKCNGKEVPMGAPTPLGVEGVYYVETSGDAKYIKDYLDHIDISHLRE